MPAESEILVGEISDAAIKQLVAVFGGRRIYVPYSLNPNHAIAKAIGIAQARRLSETYGGSPIFIPKTHCVIRRMRNLDILSAIINGEPISAIAQRYGMTARNVRIITHKMLGGNLKHYQRFKTPSK